MNNWYDDLCEYYSVDPETALKLGTRASGRKPDLPGSKTCDAVSGMTFEDIWEMKERKDNKSIFDFYKDQGAWSAFRQCVRHKDLSMFHINMLSTTMKYSKARPGFHICEYGCGVAPFLNTFVECLSQDSSQARISISDVDDCEHFKFAEWRLKKKIEKRKIDVILNVKPVMPDSLPKYDSKLDLVLVFEVLEHVPSPVATIENLYNQLNDKGVIIENFIKPPPREEEEDDGPDLLSAALERDEYYNFLNNNFDLVSGPTPDKGPNQTRTWRKK